MEAPMDAFDMPRKYKTIFICDSFGLAGGRDRDLATLRRCFDHLVDSGALILNIQAEYADLSSWSQWSNESLATLPQPWPERAARRVAQDGSEHLAYFRTLKLNPLEQSYKRQVRLEKWLAGELVASESYTLAGQMYLKNEVHLMLKVAGFRDITVTGDYTGDPVESNHDEILFTAVK
jgi:hypothetical protein